MTAPKPSASPFLARTGYTGEDGVEVLLSREGGQRLGGSCWSVGCNPVAWPPATPCVLRLPSTCTARTWTPATPPWRPPWDGWFTWKCPIPSWAAKRWKPKPRQAYHGGWWASPCRGGPSPGTAIPFWTPRETSIVGVVASGSWSPSLGHAIALGYMPSTMAKPGMDLLVQVRGRQVAARFIAALSHALRFDGLKAMRWAT